MNNTDPQLPTEQLQETDPQITLDRRMTDSPLIINQSSSIPYLVAVVIMTLVAIAASTIIVILRPNSDNSALITQILASTATVTGILISFIKLQQISSKVDGQLSNILKNTQVAARNQGIVEGQAKGHKEVIETLKVTTQVLKPKAKK